MPADRPERPRDDRDSPYGRPRDDRRRGRSRSRERDRDWGYDRGRERSPRRTPERPMSREGRRRRSGSRSAPSRDERDKERPPSPRNEGRSRGSSRSRSPSSRKRRSSPTPPPADAPRYRREFHSGYRHPSSYHDSPQHGYDSNRGRGWTRGSSYPYTPRSGYQHRHFDSPHVRTPDANYPPPQRTPPSTSPTFQSNSSVESMKPTPSTDQPQSDPAVPSGPASWRRAQQYKQDRPYQQDFRPNYTLGRGGPPMNQFPRNSPRQHLPSTSPAVSPHEPKSTSPIFQRTAIPTGPRGFGRPADVSIKKEYISPVPELDEQVRRSL